MEEMENFNSADNQTAGLGLYVTQSSKTLANVQQYLMINLHSNRRAQFVPRSTLPTTAKSVVWYYGCETQTHATGEGHCLRYI